MRVLFIGDAEREEFRAALAWLRERTELTAAASIAQGEAASLSSDAPLRLVIFGSARPGEFSRADVERIAVRFPLARLVGLLGSWCEGESRSGKPWPGVPRIYAHSFIPYLGRWLSEFDPEFPASAELPRTATDAERLLATPSFAARHQQGVAMVFARRRVTFEALADVCEISGWTAVWSHPQVIHMVRGAALVLWDSCGWGPFERDELQRVVVATTPAPLIALVDFPRLHECEQIIATGALAVVAKPFLLNDLLWQLDQVIPTKSESMLAGPHYLPIATPVRG